MYIWQLKQIAIIANMNTNFITGEFTYSVYSLYSRTAWIRYDVIQNDLMSWNKLEKTRESNKLQCEQFFTNNSW